MIRPSGLYVTTNDDKTIVSRWAKIFDLIGPRISVAVDVPPGEIDIEIDVETSLIEEVTTVGWWQGYRVSVSFLGDGGYLLRGRLRASEPDPVGVFHVDDQTKKFEAKVMSLDVISGLMSTIDRVLASEEARGGFEDVGASANLAQGHRVLLMGLMPVVTSDTGPSGAYQGTDGSLHVRSEVTRLAWRRALAKWGSQTATVCAVVGNNAFVTGVRVDRDRMQRVSGLTDSPGRASQGVWVPLSELTLIRLFERVWSTSVPPSLAQGAYGRRSIKGGDPQPNSTSHDWLTSRSPQVDTVIGRLDDEHAPGQGAVVVETTATFQGLPVSLARPFDAWESWDEAFVTGHGEAPDAWVMEDGHVIERRNPRGDSWSAIVRLCDLENVSTRFVW